ncbi:RluA family pseudouridine synthase [Candidatus Peribacteria bacterium]|nr:RluA family pseudouridine synthase [Candidatus Peribacteria bacterium]
MSEWIVPLPDRLDAFLAAEGRMLSRAKAQKAIDDRQVRVNDNVVTKSSHRLQEGDKVSLQDSERREKESGNIQSEDLHLPVLYEDDACLVIDKPAGLAVHPGAGMVENEKTVLHGIAFLFQERSLPFSTESVLVHRLDKDTTGCLLIAKTPEAHLLLQKQFETRTVHKTYLALVAGVPEVPTATVDAPIGRSVGNRTKMSVRASFTSREAQTTYRTLASVKNVALLECDLHTGRTHQIRVHLHSIGYPVLGDSSYVSALSERLTQEFDIRNICLHAWKLTFTSPADQKEHALKAGLPQTFVRALEAAGISYSG